MFSSGPVGEPKGDPNSAWLEPPKIIERIEKLGVRGHVVFGGRMAPKSRMNCPPEYRDRRDWDAINTWAVGIASELRTDREQAATD